MSQGQCRSHFFFFVATFFQFWSMGETNMPHCLCPHPVKCGGFSTGEPNRLSPPKLVVVSHGVAFCTWWGHWQLGLAPRSLFLNWLHCIMQYAIKLHHRYFLFAYPRAAADRRGGSRLPRAARLLRPLQTFPPWC